MSSARCCSAQPARSVLFGAGRSVMARSETGARRQTRERPRRTQSEVRMTHLSDSLVLVTIADSESASESDGLSTGERDVVALAARGLSNQQIAKARNCATRTVANQLANAYRKLGVSGRRELRALLR